MRLARCLISNILEKKASSDAFFIAAS